MPSGPVVVVGGTLAGLAAAARLAKAGHPVMLLDAADRLDGRSADLPAVIRFPAPLRDLFRKSGRPLEAELARHRAELAPAPATVLRFADGSELTWPSDRGEQVETLTHRFGPGPAGAWRDLLDRLDDTWQVVRRVALERELRSGTQLTPALHRVLHGAQSVADLAERAGHPDLRALLRSEAYRLGSPPEQTPAWCAAYAAVERTFGRWRIATDDDRDAQTSVLVGALVDRLATRKVDLQLGCEVTGIKASGVQTASGRIAAAAVIAAIDPWRTAGLLPAPNWLGRGPARRIRRAVADLQPALAPTVSQHTGEPVGPLELVDLDEVGAPRVTYTRSSGRISVHDFRRPRPDPAYGARWSLDGWLARPPATTDWPGLFLAGPATRTGGGLAATILSGALASYGVHDFLTN